MRSWSAEHDRLLGLMAKANWSIHMVAAQLARIAYDVETRAAILGVSLYDRSATPEKCSKCGKQDNTDCPFFWRECGFTVAQL